MTRRVGADDGPALRRATRADRDDVVDTVVAAFRGDPAWDFILDGEFERFAALFAGALFDSRVDDAEIWIAGDVAGVAMWELAGPDVVASPEADAVWATYRDAVGESAWRRLDAYQRALDACQLSEPYSYLGVLATRPSDQGRGIGSALIGAFVDGAEAASLPACLETSTLANRAFYGRRGFTGVRDVDLVGGPPTWWLRRDPR